MYLILQIFALIVMGDAEIIVIVQQIRVQLPGQRFDRIGIIRKLPAHAAVQLGSVLKEGGEGGGA